MEHTTVKRASEIEIGDQLYLAPTLTTASPWSDPWCTVVVSFVDQGYVTLWIGRDNRVTFPGGAQVLVRTREDAQAPDAEQRERIARRDAVARDLLTRRSRGAVWVTRKLWPNG